MPRTSRVAAAARRAHAVVFWQPDPNTVHPDDMAAPNGHDRPLLHSAPTIEATTEVVAAAGIAGREADGGASGQHRGEMKEST